MDNKEENINEAKTKIDVKGPKRILHFSDGTMEEFSDDEIDNLDKPVDESQVVDVKALPWGPWMVHNLWSAGSTTLAACDYVGESLASFFGITTPKYHFEIEEYKRQEEEKRKLAEQRAGWCDQNNGNICTDEPTAV